MLQCIPQRSALIKSILNFLRKLVTDSTFVEESRSSEFTVPLRLFMCQDELFFLNLVHSSPLIGALKHIFSNSQYYGATLFLAGTCVHTFSEVSSKSRSIVYLQPVLVCWLAGRHDNAIAMSLKSIVDKANNLFYLEDMIH